MTDPGRRPSSRVLVALGALVAAVALVAGVTGAAIAGWAGQDDGRQEAGGGSADRAGDADPPRLRVEGNLVVDERGERHVMMGATLYAFPFYLTDSWIDETVQIESRRIAEHLDEHLDAMAAAGLNSVRVPLGTPAWQEDLYALTTGEWLDRLEHLVDAAGERGMHVMVTWWDALTYADRWPDEYEASFPFMRAVHERVGDRDHVLIEPMNEPRGITWEQWIDATGATVEFWRDELGYDGILLLDTIDWAWNFDPTAADRLLEIDAAARGEPNLVFAIHRYANENDCFCGDEREEWVRIVGRHVEEYPIMVTELGNMNAGNEPSRRWVNEFSDHLAQVDLPAGLNGVQFFTWRWQDANTMTEPDGQQLTTFGRDVLQRLVRDERSAPQGGDHGRG